jgi:hypothetical protein
MSQLDSTCTGPPPSGKGKAAASDPDDGATLLNRIRRRLSGGMR